MREDNKQRVLFNKDVLTLNREKNRKVARSDKRTIFKALLSSLRHRGLKVEA